MKDERIEQAKNKIWSELAKLMLVGVALSFLVKTLVFKMSQQECLTEFLILVLTPLYQFIRMNMLKVNVPIGQGNRHPIIRSLAIPLTVLVVIYLAAIFDSLKKSPAYNWQGSIVFLAVFLILYAAIFFMVNKFNQHRSQKYEKEFGDDND